MSIARTGVLWALVFFSTCLGAGAVAEPGRTLSLGIEVDRHSARLLAFTVKDRPFRARPTVGPRAYDPERNLQLEVVLLGPNGERRIQRVDGGPLCLDHEPDQEPHVEGDTVRPHRDSVIVEVAEIPGFDRVEVGLYEHHRGRLERRSLGETRLERAQFRQAAGTIGYDELAIATPSLSTEQPPLPLASTPLWPEDFADPDLYRIYGDPGEGDRRVNIVIVPDGYTYAEKALMEQHADDFVNYARGETPLDEHDNLINYTLVYAYSVESGTDQCDCGIVRDTAMGTRFTGAGSCGSSANRCLFYGSGCDDPGTANIVAAELRAPFHDRTLIMVNTTRYGGCAGGRAVYSAGNASGEDVAVHEIGHNVAGLADEYTSNSGCGSSGGGINTSTDPVNGAWPEWIADLGSPREGARYWTECIYRPESSCKMRSLGPDFCAVCAQRWSLVVFGHPRVSPTAPVETFSPPSSSLQLLIGSDEDFSVTTRLAQGAGVTNSIAWSVTPPGAPTPTVVATDTTSLNYVFDQLGDYTVTCEVVADTNFIKPEKNGGNRDLIQWDVEVVATVCEIGCAHGIAECDADGDGMGDACDPCPGQTLNECFGPAAVDDTAGVAIRINTDGESAAACSGDKTDCRGKSWLADFGAPASSSGYNQADDPVVCDLPNGCPVVESAVFGCSGTSTAELFRCAHEDPAAAPELNYGFDLPDGEYVVNLLFMNPTSLTASPGSRVFSIEVNGESQPQFSSLDPVTVAGGTCDPQTAPCIPISRSMAVTVGGGTGLEIELISDVGRPVIAGVEVLCELKSWFADTDQDGFGNAAAQLDACVQPAGHVADATDCNDGDPNINPAAPEICDTLDNDCDLVADEDDDLDGFDACMDCDETNAGIHGIPGEVEGLLWQGLDFYTWLPVVETGGSGSFIGVLRSEDPTDFSNAVCLLGNYPIQAQGFWFDQTVPPAGVARYYLIFGENDCGIGTLGSGTGGLPRNGPSCMSDDGTGGNGN